MRRFETLCRATVIATLSIALAGPTTRAGEVSLRGLIEEMASLERLANFPEPAYTNRQFSSYDRAAKSPAENWFANGDQGQYLRTETGASGKKEFVCMDAEGPGAIVRIWSADPKGTLRIYIDGEPKPALEASMADLLGGKVKPFVPPIACETSRGFNIYFPFAYRARCKVTSDASPFYYQINYRTYPTGTAVESFAPAMLAGLGGDVERAAMALADPGASPGGPASEEKEFSADIAPGETRPLFQIAKGGAIRGLRLKVEGGEAQEVLRKCVLIARFDSEDRPSIWAPVGDFFGAAPGINPYRSLPLSVEKDGEMDCRWVMPFERGARFSVWNSSGVPVTVRGLHRSGPFAWSDRALHFHARWKVEHDMPTRPMRDWTYLDASGKGVFVGDSLAVANPVTAWWGEGDEKIYVDGEPFPSHFGTGTEDYYGYAWCCNVPFQHPYHAQPRVDGPGNFGHTSVNRWHILDSIPFTRSFKFDMEVWHWHETCKVSYAATSYWYARPGSGDRGVESPASDLRVPVLPERGAKVKGAIEGETLKVLSRKGVADGQGLEGHDGSWSGESHLWWREAKPGDELVLEFPAPKTGRYRVIAAMTRAVDYGIHQLSVNGEKAGEPIDLFHRGVVPTGPVDLGAFALKEGANTLTVKVVGTNPAASPKNHMFGLDYLLLKPE